MFDVEAYIEFRQFLIYELPPIIHNNFMRYIVLIVDILLDELVNLLSRDRC